MIYPKIIENMKSKTLTKIMENMSSKQIHFSNNSIDIIF